MDQISLIGKARRAARCGASGKRRNAAGGLIWPTEGRVVLPRDSVAFLIRCPTSHGETRLATQQDNPVKVTRSCLKGLWK